MRSITEGMLIGRDDVGAKLLTEPGGVGDKVGDRVAVQSFQEVTQRKSQRVLQAAYANRRAHVSLR